MDLVELQKKAFNPEAEVSEAPSKDLGKPADVEIKFAKRVESFELKYIDDETNKEKVAQLHSKVMDYAGRQRYDRVLSDLSAGMNFDNLPFETRNRYICIARSICQLIDPPEWVLKKIGEDLELCYSIGGRLFDHENRFFRNSPGKNSAEENKPRFQLN